MHTPEEEKFLNTKSEIEAMIVSALGGRAAEEIVFGNVTTGASNDIEQATNYARTMITMYGMSDKFGLIALESVENQYLDGRRVLNCADATAAQIDQEVMRLLKESYEKAKALLKDNRTIMDRIAAFLIEQETITGKEFMNIFHEARADQKKQEELAQKQIELKQESEVESAAQDPIDLEGEQIEEKQAQNQQQQEEQIEE